MKKRGFAAAILVGFHFGLGAPALAQTHLTPPPPSTVEQPQPHLNLERGTLSVSLAADGQPVVAASGEVGPPLAADLLERVAKGEMTEDEASTVMAEVKQLDGLSYTVPDLVEMKKDLGFPSDTAFDVEDLPQLLVSHVQLTIGVGPVSASYLADRLGSSSLVNEAIAHSDSVNLAAGVATEAAVDPKAVVADSNPEPLAGGATQQ